MPPIFPLPQSSSFSSASASTYPFALLLSLLLLPRPLAADPIPSSTELSTFDSESPGAQPLRFDHLAGSWSVADRAGARGIAPTGKPGADHIAAWKGDCAGDPITLSVRYHGRADAGLAFAIAPDGSWIGASPRQLFRFARGKRTPLATARPAPAPTPAWHTLRLLLDGRHVTLEHDGHPLLSATLSAPPSGRCGLFAPGSPALLFDNFSITRAAPPR